MHIHVFTQLIGEMHRNLAHNRVVLLHFFFFVSFFDCFSCRFKPIAEKGCNPTNQPLAKTGKEANLINLADANCTRSQQTQQKNKKRKRPANRAGKLLIATYYVREP